MLFNSLGFLFLFLPLVLAGYQLCARHRVCWLAASSLFFYAWWDIRFLPLLLLSIAVNFLAGRAICGNSGGRREAIFWCALVFNLGLLIWFKYAGFLFGLATGLPLPIGISFFTFTQLAFLADCRQGRASEPQVGPYVLFVSYFPHLIAGPVLHHAEMMPQFRHCRGLQARDLATGLTIFAMGLAKKVLLADNLAPMAAPVFAADSAPALLEAWIGVLAYSLQLYFDFSGYSDMAVGLSRMFGVRLPENFNAPYQASSIAEFWRRWHMTLSRFLRDYLYIPLGGNRAGRWRRLRNLMLTMLLGGAWHGAGWTYILWGGLHGVYLVVQQWIGGGAARWWHRPLTFLAVMWAWVPFRARDLASTFDIWGGLLGAHGVNLPHGLGFMQARLGRWDGLLRYDGLQWIDLGGVALPLLASAACIAWLLPTRQALLATRWDGQMRWSGAVAALLLACIFTLNRPTAFLYFQF